jgi:hypothetical protein
LCWCCGPGQYVPTRGGCPGRDRERDTSRIPRSDLAPDASLLNRSWPSLVAVPTAKDVVRSASAPSVKPCPQARWPGVASISGSPRWARLSRVDLPAETAARLSSVSPRAACCAGSPQPRWPRDRTCPGHPEARGAQRDSSTCRESRPGKRRQVGPG